MTKNSDSSQEDMTFDQYDSFDKILERLRTLPDDFRGLKDDKGNKKLHFTKFVNVLETLVRKLEHLDPVPNICYQSIYDEAYNMARTLQDIDQELTMAAQCEGDHPGGYPSERLLPNMCKIMYRDFGYYKADKYHPERTLKKENK